MRGCRPWRYFSFSVPAWCVAALTESKSGLSTPLLNSLKKENWKIQFDSTNCLHSKYSNIYLQKKTTLAYTVTTQPYRKLPRRSYGVVSLPPYLLDNCICVIYTKLFLLPRLAVKWWWPCSCTSWPQITTGSWSRACTCTASSLWPSSQTESICGGLHWLDGVSSTFTASLHSCDCPGISRLL